MAEDLLSAITAGIQEAGGSIVPDQEGTDDETSNDSSTTAGADGSAEGDSELSSNENGAAAEVDGGDADQQQADQPAEAALAGKKPVAAKPGQEGEAKAGAAAAKPGTTDQPAKKLDPLNDPIPNALKPQTKERIQTLIGMNKSVTTERDTAVAERDELMQHIVETGATPEQYGETLGVLRMLNSQNAADQEQAYAYMNTALQALGARLGKVVPGVDVLAQHTDLQEAVQAGTMLQQHAEELAAARNQRTVNTQLQQRERQISEQERQRSTAVQLGKEDLNTLGAELQAADGVNFTAKHAILKSALAGVIAKADPKEWASIYKKAYTALKLPTNVRAAPVQQLNQPLRAKTPAGGAVRGGASTMLDAVNQALGRTVNQE